jgi:hypothetical protein
VTLPARPRLAVFEVILDLSLPARPHTTPSQGEGGFDVSAAGVPESYEIRRDDLLRVRLRLTAHEWVQYRELVARWQAAMGTVGMWRNDQTRPDTERSVYLVHPAMGEPVEAELLDDVLDHFETELELRVA